MDLVTFVLKTGRCSHGPSDLSIYAYTPPGVILPVRSEAPPANASIRSDVKIPCPFISTADSVGKLAVKIVTPSLIVDVDCPVVFILPRNPELQQSKITILFLHLESFIIVKISCIDTPQSYLV